MGTNRRLDRGTAATLVIEDLGEAEGNRSSAEAGDDARNHLAQRIQMVSAFQGHGESARAEAGRARAGSWREVDGPRGGQGRRRAAARGRRDEARGPPGATRAAPR